MFLHLQYLVCLNQTFVFLLGAACLCRYQHNNRTCVWTKTTVTRPSDGSGPVPNDCGLTPIRTNYQVYAGKKLRAKTSCSHMCFVFWTWQGTIDVQRSIWANNKLWNKHNVPMFSRTQHVTSCFYLCCSHLRHIWRMSRLNIVTWFVGNSFWFALSSLGCFSVW